MTDLPQEKSLDRRVKQRLQSRYVRWLARNKPDTFCYREPWRGFLRSRRRISQSFWGLFGSFLPDWLIVGYGVIAGVFLVAAVLGLGGTFAWYVFHESPSGGQLSIDDQAEVGFFRLAVMQFGALLALILMGVSFPDRSDENRDFKHAMSRDHRRVQVNLIRVFIVAMITLGWIAAFLIPLDQPSYVLGMLATGLTGTILFWAAHWISLWLGRLRIPSDNRNVKDLSRCLGLFFCLGVFLFAVFPDSIPCAKHLPWLGPTGWLNEQARQMGNGNWIHAWPLGGGWCVLLVVGLVFRRQVKTWRHRRLVLRLGDSNPGDITYSRERSEFTLAEIPADFRERLSGLPTSWSEWLLPAWIRPARTLLLTMAVCCLVAQGVACYLHLVLTRLGEVNQELVRSELLLVYIAIGVMVGTVEICGLYNQDQALRSPLERQVLSPGGLWKRMQFRGLIRVPVTIFCTLPMLIVPIIVNQGDPVMSLLTLGLSLSAAFALRTLVAAIIAQQAIYREMNEYLAAGLMLLAMGLACGILVVIMLAAVPDFLGSHSVVWRQLAAHGSTLLVFIIATCLWSYAPLLAGRSSQV